MKTRIVAAVFAGLCSLGLVSTASAAIISVTFTAQEGYSGEFRYDDTAIARVDDIPYLQGGTSYDALSFSINGTAQTGPFYVQFYDDFSGNDYVYFTGAKATGPLIQLKGDTSVLTGSGLAQLTDMTLASWSSNSDNTNDLYTAPYAGQNQNPGVDTHNLTAISISQVPLPAAAWLFISALGGLVVAKRRQLKA